MDVYAYTYRAELLHLQGFSHPHPQASVAHSRQPRPYSSLGFQVKFLRIFQGVPSSLWGVPASCRGHRGALLRLHPHPPLALRIGFRVQGSEFRVQGVGLRCSKGPTPSQNQKRDVFGDGSSACGIGGGRAVPPPLARGFLLEPAPLFVGVTPGFGFRVSGFGFRVSGFRFRVFGFGLGAADFGFQVSGDGYRVSGIRFHELRVHDFA